MTTTYTKSRYQVTHSALPGMVFITSSGTGGSASVTKRRHTPGGPEETIRGRHQLKNITVMIAHTRDTESLAQKLLAGNPLRGSITRVSLDADDVAVPGSSVTFSDAVVTDYSIPDTDVNDDEPGDITIEFAIGKKA